MTAEFPAIEGIEPPLPDGGWPWWATALAAAAVLAAALVGWWLLRRRARPEPVPPTPREVASGALGRLRERIGSLTGNELSVAVVEVLREFVVAEFGVPATRQTSAEFLESAARNPRIGAGGRERLSGVMELCDLVKFAGIEATVQEGVRLLDEAARFVEGAPPPLPEGAA
jgi:hypothetical protein